MRLTASLCAVLALAACSAEHPADVSVSEAALSSSPLVVNVSNDQTAQNETPLAVNPTDPTKIEAVAYGEAIVQRTTGPASNGLGRKFIITYFRWIGSDEI